MKRSLLLVLSIGLFLASCGGGGTKNDPWGLNCPVKSIKVTTYNAKSKFGEVVKDKIAIGNNYIATFNASGDAETISYFDNEGELLSMSKYKYNSDGRLMELSSYDQEGDLDYQHIYEYEGERVIKYVSKYYWDDTTDIYEVTNEWNGEYLISVKSTRNGELQSVAKYSKWDKSGAEWIEYDGNGDEKGRGEIVYDENGYIKKYNTQTSNVEIERNDKNLPVYIKGARPDSGTGFILSEEYKENTFYIEYEYDERGNWIKQTIYEGEIKMPKTISEREITY